MDIYRKYFTFLNYFLLNARLTQEIINLEFQRHSQLYTCLEYKRLK